MRRFATDLGFVLSVVFLASSPWTLPRILPEAVMRPIETGVVLKKKTTGTSPIENDIIRREREDEFNRRTKG